MLPKLEKATLTHHLENDSLSPSPQSHVDQRRSRANLQPAGAAGAELPLGKLMPKGSGAA